MSEEEKQGEAAVRRSVGLPVACPKCRKRTIHGFGLAYGGYGPYCFCSTKHCDYFAKIQVER